MSRFENHASQTPRANAPFQFTRRGRALGLTLLVAAGVAAGTAEFLTREDTRPIPVERVVDDPRAICVETRVQPEGSYRDAVADAVGLYAIRGVDSRATGKALEAEYGTAHPYQTFHLQLNPSNRQAIAIADGPCPA